VAASMDKRRQARNFEREQIEQRDRLSAQPPPRSRANGHENNSAATDSEELATAKPSPLRLRKPSAEQLSTTGFRSRKHRDQQKQLLGQEVVRTLPQFPSRSRPKAVSRKLLKAQQTASQPDLRPYPEKRQAQSDFEPRPSARDERGKPLSQNPDLRIHKTQEPGYTRQENNPFSNSSAKLQRLNPWAVNLKSNVQNPQSALRQGVNLKSESLGVRESQSSKSLSIGDGRNRPAINDAQTSEPLKPQNNSRLRRRKNERSRITETVSSGAAQERATRARRRAKLSSNLQASQTQRTQNSRRPQKRPVNPWIYIVRMLILGIGIGAIAGTLLSALNPATQASAKANNGAKSQAQESPTPVASPSPSLQLTQEIPALKAQIQTLALQNTKLQPGVFVVDLDTGAYLDLDGGIPFASASTIKLPILVAFFQDVDAGKIRLDEVLTLKSEAIADGSGDLQFKQVGTQYTALEVATKMIVVSDNTATNMLVERLGGAQALNQRFRSWGLTTTAIRNRLPDVEGTNTTSPQELAKLMSIVHRGQLVSVQSRDRLLNIMQRNEINTLLPQGLGVGATIAHKTGNIGGLLADAGIVDLPTGKRYAIAVMVKRPRNDESAQELIRQISRKTYDYFNQPRATPSNTSMPSRSTSMVTKASGSGNLIY